MTHFTHLTRHLKRHHLPHNLSSFTLKLITYPWRCLPFHLSSLLRRLNSFLLHLLYFISVSSIGFLLLNSTASRQPFTSPKGLDLFFTSVSAATVSSMTAVEMEVFSNTQLLVLTVLMFIGGEVFTSMVGLYIKKRRLQKLISKSIEDKVASVTSSDDLSVHHAELGEEKPEAPLSNPDYIRYRSVRMLGFIILAYVVGTLMVGTSLVLAYLTVMPTGGRVLEQKGLKKLTFSAFISVSTFVNCGFVPTNENMVVFRENSGLLLLLIPQVLMGNTLFPWCLRVCLWGFGKLTKREEINYLLNNKEKSYSHLLPKLQSWLLFGTVLGFIGVQLVMFCAMEWSGESLRGLSVYEKIVGVLFMCVNSRHAGESVVDISAIAPAMVVMFVVMMYLPPYTSFVPVSNEEEDFEVVEKEKPKRQIRIKIIIENLILSQLSYLSVFIILVCITERENMKKDPLNFSVLSIIVEVISAYGNVGFTMGYSCKRQVIPEVGCKDKWLGFSGKWSDEGKIIMILVMIFGRLKQFNINGGKAWKL